MSACVGPRLSLSLDEDPADGAHPEVFHRQRSPSRRHARPRPDHAGRVAAVRRRHGRNTRLLGLLPQTVYGSSPATRKSTTPSASPATRRCAPSSGRRGSVAHGPDHQMGRLETEGLATEANLAVLAHLPGTWIDWGARAQAPRTGSSLDLDSSESPTYGQHEGDAERGTLSRRATSGIRVPQPRPACGDRQVAAPTTAARGAAGRKGPPL